MSLLRILLEGDHGSSFRYSPMTYQHKLQLQLQLNKTNKMLEIEMTRRVAKESGQRSFNFYPLDLDLINTTICQKSTQYLRVTLARHIGSSPIFPMLK